MKSGTPLADAKPMDQFLAAMLGPSELWLVLGMIAAWLVLTCLKAIATDIDHAVRWHDLNVEVERLSDKQNRRLKELGIKRRRHS